MGNTIETIWGKKIKKRLDSRKGQYIHFDDRTSYNTHLSYITDANLIKKHAFLPFIKFVRKQRKVVLKSGKLKRKFKKRTLYYSAHLDSKIFLRYASILEFYYEKIIKKRGLSDFITAYRSINSTNITLAKEVFDHIKERKTSTAITLDISNFFDNLDHKIIKETWKKTINSKNLPDDHYNVFKSITKYSWVNKNTIYRIFNINKPFSVNRICSMDNFKKIVRTKHLISNNKKGKGIPQGSPISAILANIYMLDFDTKVATNIEKYDGFYRRYSDDIIIICNPSDKSKISGYIEKQLEKIKLQLNPEKTVERNFYIEKGNLVCTNNKVNRSTLQYLGFEFNGKDIFIRSSSINRAHSKLSRAIKKTVNHAKKTPSFKKGIIYKKNIYETYSHLGRRTFISYAKNAKNVMQSDAIKKQSKKQWNKIDKLIQYHSNRKGEMSKSN